MDAERLFLENLGLIERICSFVCQRNRVFGDDALEFTQEAKFRLIEGDYAIIRKFEGRSAISTYLTTVIQRIFHQYRIEQWGKWRPSAEAKRLGDKAITLERLLSRDGLSFSEAVQSLTTAHGATFSVAEIEAIYLRLPKRNPRPVLVSDEVVPETVVAIETADNRVLASERAETARSCIAVVDQIIEEFPDEDRLILRMRFQEARKVPDIAQRLHIEQKKLYKRLDKLFATMKKGLERAGVTRADVDRLLTGGDQELRFRFEVEETDPVGPSNRRDGVGGGKGRS